MSPNNPFARLSAATPPTASPIFGVHNQRSEQPTTNTRRRNHHKSIT